MSNSTYKTTEFNPLRINLKVISYQDLLENSLPYSPNTIRTFSLTKRLTVFLKTLDDSLTLFNIKKEDLYIKDLILKYKDNSSKLKLLLILRLDLIIRSISGNRELLYVLEGLS
jgi:hypothetical protein